MQNLERLCLVLWVALALASCKNETAKPGQSAAAAPEAATTPVAIADTMMGFKGAEKAAFQLLSPGVAEFRYQNYVVKTTDRSDQAGQLIEITPTNGSPAFRVPGDDAAFFAGISRNRLFVDVGTGPDGRQFRVFHLGDRKSVWQTNYVGEPEIMSNGKLWYLDRVPQRNIEELPDCPEKAEWEKQGLQVRYGQVCIYNLVNDIHVRKSEWRCVAMQ